MGRAGRSGGGSGRSSGGGGSRSSGGRSGGSGRSGRSGNSRSGGSSSWGSKPFSWSSGHRHRRPPIFVGGYYGRNRYYGRRIGGFPLMGCLTVIAILFILMIIFTVLFNSSGSVTKSTVKREPLPRGSVTETNYYTDELGWIQSGSKLTTGMKNFYQKTGVQPYLYITETVNGVSYPTDDDMDSYAFELYDRLFTDEAHLLILFYERDDRYKTWYVAGIQAKAVIDNEAADILLDYIDKYYYGSMDEDEFFSKAFQDAGDRIMAVTTSPWIPVAGGCVVLCLAAVGFVWWKKAKEQRNLEAEQTERILNTPLEELGSGQTGLEDKYKD